MRTPTRVLLGLAAAAVAMSGGSVLTAGNTLGGDNVAGYAAATVSGATSTRIEHTLSADGAHIVATALTFSADSNTNRQVMAGFGSGNLVTCSPTNGANQSDPWTASCTYGATAYPTATTTSFVVAVS